MHALLSLANTESHNFTAEVLLREGADSWDLNRALLANTQWLQAQGMPMRGLRIRDGSGLSRANRVTSRTLATLLWRMAQHPLGAYYQASMAIAGVAPFVATGGEPACRAGSGGRPALSEVFGPFLEFSKRATAPVTSA